MTKTFTGKIDTLLALRADGRLLVGRERITLLEAVVKHGSITKAAEVAGFSYKTAWDAVNAINNILPRPAFITRTGGPHGGGAEVTEEGRRLIATFRRLEEKLGKISDSIVEVGLEHEEDLLFWGLSLKLSIRNAYHCKVVEVIPSPVNVSVKLIIGPETEIYAFVTNKSVVELGLAPGRSAVALINPPSVHLMAVGDPPKIAVRNKLKGFVIDRVDGASDSELSVDLGGGKTIVSVSSRESADAAGVVAGVDVWAVFESADVILACD
ncbi:TOBE domain-containing protein [Methylocapsa palsarum]|uniref:Molybdate transport system regulatory protein n=1 Tax=Methylocapsa palsarum TaxID=1612308 RepID=A0A1I3XWI5_9HYPH|nr:TOBE domain-containing protein [Methylocapsa palsarum]SFK23346.1 molybdate transport system regulatory protein [Methylocapsa palsarum]